MKELNAIFANEKIAAIGGVESWALQLVDSVGIGFIGRPICPSSLETQLTK